MWNGYGTDTDCLRSCTNRLKSFEQSTEGNNGANSLSRRNGKLVILGKPTGVIEPSQGTFNNPAFWQNFPSWFDARGNINVQAQFPGNTLHKSLAVACVGTEALNGWIFLKSSSCYPNPRLCIMDVGSMNYHCQQITHCIHYDVPFASFCFFPPSMPRSFAAEVVFTLCESMMA